LPRTFQRDACEQEARGEYNDVPRIERPRNQVSALQQLVPQGKHERQRPGAKGRAREPRPQRERVREVGKAAKKPPGQLERAGDQHPQIV
jgi:hypothetical protein